MPGKHLYTADTLLRAPIESGVTDTTLQKEVELLSVATSDLLARKERLEEYKKAQANDPICSVAVVMDGRRNMR